MIQKMALILPQWEWNTEKCTAYTSLATIYMRKKWNLDKAIGYAHKGIDCNRYAMDAWQMLTVIYRLKNDQPACR